ncbi:MAG: addiction module protein [Acidobacteriota bacterium]
MELTLEQLEAEALKLSVEARARLAQRLLRSIEPAAESEIDLLWIDEAQRRHQELLAGAQAVPADEVFAKARALLK